MLTVVYGLETGTAEDTARVLANRLRRSGEDPLVVPMDGLEPARLLATTVLLVVVLTTGQGDVPRNGRKLWRMLLSRLLPGNVLRHLRFLTFGIGDSSYPHFNYAAKKVHARLLQLGAAELAPRAEADELLPQGVEAYYGEWEALVTGALGLGEMVADETVLPPINPVSVGGEWGVFTKQRVHSSTTLVSGLVSLTRTTPDTHFQDVRRVVLTDPARSLAYVPGDTVGLYPQNDSGDVQLLITNQGWEDIADAPLAIGGPQIELEGGWVPQLTLRRLLTHHLDIMLVPRRSFFSLVWRFAGEERERERLQEFSQIELVEDLYNYANRPRRSILEVVLEFDSLRLPLEHLVDLFPTIKPRLFSIASAPSSGQVELAVAMVEYRTILRRIRKGVCSRWLKSLNDGDPVVFLVHASGLRFGHLAQPLIMVGPGTGIAPMRSLVEHERAAHPGRPMALFHGFRNAGADQLFAEYWETAHPEWHYVPCALRDSHQPNGKYVQDGLWKYREMLVRWMVESEAVVFVCGSNGSMPRQVRITLETALGEVLGEEAGKARIRDMEQAGRYIQETW